jgi:hypothetical protein
VRIVYFESVKRRKFLEVVSLIDAECTVTSFSVVELSETPARRVPRNADRSCEHRSDSLDGLPLRLV